MIDLPEGAFMTEFADEVVLTTMGKELELTTTTELTVFLTQRWLRYLGHSLAEHKSEAVLIFRKKTLQIAQ